MKRLSVEQAEYPMMANRFRTVELRRMGKDHRTERISNVYQRTLSVWTSNFAAWEFPIVSFELRKEYEMYKVAATYREQDGFRLRTLKNFTVRSQFDSSKVRTSQFILISPNSSHFEARCTSSNYIELNELKRLRSVRFELPINMSKQGQFNEIQIRMLEPSKCPSEPPLMGVLRPAVSPIELVLTLRTLHDDSSLSSNWRVVI